MTAENINNDTADELENVSAPGGSESDQPDADNITLAYLKWAQANGWNRILFREQGEQGGRSLRYRDVARAAVALQDQLLARQKGSPGNRMGIMLPSSAGAATVFYAAIFAGLCPVMLNPAGGGRNLVSACHTTQVRVVYTSQRLLDKLPAAGDAVNALRDDGIEVVLLEDVRKLITLRSKLRAVFAGLLIHRPHQGLRRNWFGNGMRAAPEDPAVVLMTSGSEGFPKGVALSHRNLLANVTQVLSRLSGLRRKRMVNALPIFHTFGLFAGVLLPAAGGIQAFHYPSPLHYREVPKAIRREKAHIFFSADSFLSAYGREADAEDLNQLQHVFAGAEKLKDSTRQQWQEKFGVDILQGYGVTETSPVISVNTENNHVPGSVGLPMAGIEVKIVPAEGIDRGGLLHVRGKNVMLGYFEPDNPGALKPPPDGWHNTGDIVEQDENGYLHIRGRLRRFVKIAGEMTPLDGVEDALRKAFPDVRFAVFRMEDATRGEQIGTLCDDAGIDRQTIAARFQEEKIPPLWVPRRIIMTSDFPQLPSGKTDYVATQKLAEETPVADDGVDAAAN